MSKSEKSVIEVKGTEIGVLSANDEDFISLTDIARHRESASPDDLIGNWLRNRNTVEFLDLWEQLHNDGIKMQLGLRAFRYRPNSGSRKPAPSASLATPDFTEGLTRAPTSHLSSPRGFRSSFGFISPESLAPQRRIEPHGNRAKRANSAVECECHRAIAIAQLQSLADVALRIERYSQSENGSPQQLLRTASVSDRPGQSLRNL